MKGMEEMTREEGGKIIDGILEEARRRFAPKYPPLTAYKITYSNGKTTSTSMAAGITLGDAKQYFIGQWFDLGIDDKEDMQQAIKVEELST